MFQIVSWLYNSDGKGRMKEKIQSEVNLIKKITGVFTLSWNMFTFLTCSQALIQ